MPTPEHVEALVRMVQERLGLHGHRGLDHREQLIVECFAHFVDSAVMGACEGVLGPIGEALKDLQKRMPLYVVGVDEAKR